MATTKAAHGEQNQRQIEFSAVSHDSMCARCGGLMVRDFCTDLLSRKGELDCPTWRCVQCGDVVDPVIRWNRHLQQLADGGREIKVSTPALYRQRSV